MGTVRNGESHGFPNGAGLTDYVAVIGVNIAQSGKDKRPRCLAGRERIENTASIMTELMQKQVNAMKHYYLGVCHKKDGQVVIGDWCRTHREASERARSFRTTPWEAIELKYAKGLAGRRSVMCGIALSGIRV